MSMQMDPTVMYAIPRKGFFPPNSEVVERITLFVPLKGVTRKPEKEEDNHI